MTAMGDRMTTGDAADLLGVSVRQVRNLLDAGELTAAGRVGTNLLLDAASVHQLRERGSQPGRPWSPETAWAAVDLLDSGRTDRLTAAQRSRLRARLRVTDSEEFVRLARRRATAYRYRASDSLLTRLREHVALTGRAAVAGDRDVAARFGLAGGGDAGVDGYVDRARLRDFEDEYFLARDPGGNVVLRAVDNWNTTAATTGADATIALDLADSLDTRARSAGLRMLGDKLQTL